MDRDVAGDRDPVQQPGLVVEVGDRVVLGGPVVPDRDVADYDDEPRLLHRITVAGSVPVGINGDTAVVRKGDASHYSEIAS